jgi:hypothetical protein
MKFFLLVHGAFRHAMTHQNIVGMMVKNKSDDVVPENPNECFNAA